MDDPIANRLSLEQIDAVVATMRASGQLVDGPRGLMCTLAPTVDARGRPKYPQKDVRSVTNGRVTSKVLVHHIVWRHRTRAMVDPALDISHLDKDKAYVEATQEETAMNESRKYCHLFGWYKIEAAGKKRCPHWEHPCTGPE